MLPSAYAAAKFHVLPSKFEFPGMVTLEAAATGCSVVSGPYPTIEDCLGDRIYYRDPMSLESIRENVERISRKGVTKACLNLFSKTKHVWAGQNDLRKCSKS